MKIEWNCIPILCPWLSVNRAYNVQLFPQHLWMLELVMPFLEQSPVQHVLALPNVYVPWHLSRLCPVLCALSIVDSSTFVLQWSCLMALTRVLDRPGVGRLLAVHGFLVPARRRLTTTPASRSEQAPGNAWLQSLPARPTHTRYRNWQPSGSLQRQSLLRCRACCSLWFIFSVVSVYVAPLTPRRMGFELFGHVKLFWLLNGKLGK